MVLLPQQALVSSTFDPDFKSLLDPQTYNQLQELTEALSRQMIRPLLQTPPEGLLEKVPTLLPAYIEYMESVLKLSLPLPDLEIFFRKIVQSTTVLMEERRLQPGALAALKMATDTYQTFLYRLMEAVGDSEIGEVSSELPEPPEELNGVLFGSMAHTTLLAWGTTPGMPANSGTPEELCYLIHEWWTPLVGLIPPPKREVRPVSVSSEAEAREDIQLAEMGMDSWSKGLV